jgi:hypothetical protein
VKETQTYRETHRNRQIQRQRLTDKQTEDRETEEVEVMVSDLKQAPENNLWAGKQ